MTTPPHTPAPRTGASSFWAVVAVVIAVFVAGAAVVRTDSNSPVEAAPVVTTTTTTTTSPSTTVVPTVPRWQTTIATVINPSIEILADPPAGVVVDGVGRTVRDNQARDAGWAQYSAAPDGQLAIPAIDRPVVGRERTVAGWRFDNPSGWGDTLTFTVVEDHGDWLKVMVPARPNGAEGWIRTSDVITTTTNYHVTIDLGARTLTVDDGDTEIISTPVVTGKDSTPTPAGRFFITDRVEKYAGSAYGPWILPLSGFSLALDEFAGGAPVIAIHGTNQPGLAGTAASNGCIRVPSDEIITRLRNELPLGTPVDII